MNRTLLPLLLLLGLGACVSDPDPRLRYDPTQPSEPRTRSSRPPSPSTADLQPGQVVAQGMIGVTQADKIQRSSGSDGRVETSSFDQLPLIAGAFQFPMWGKRVDMGLEAGGSLGWRSNGSAWYAGGGGLAVAVSVDMLIFDLFGGFFASTYLGDKVRAYAGVGPLIQFVDYSSQEEAFPYRDESSSGFGAGWYARVGVDLVVSRALMVGAGARWSDTQVDLSNGMGDLDVEGTQLYVSFTSGF